MESKGFRASAEENQRVNKKGREGKRKREKDNNEKGKEKGNVD